MWPNNEADMVFWTDVSLRLALSFAYVGHRFVYRIQRPEKQIVDIVFLELVAIFSAIHHATMLPHPPHHLLVWMDSLDAVGVFRSLHAAESMHNALLLGVAEIILQSGIDLWVWHIEGRKNVHANMLWHLLLDEYAQKFPADRICLFDPPRDFLPVMEGVLLAILGGHERVAHHACPQMDLSCIDQQVFHLQASAIERSSVNGYATGAHDYINFCVTHSLPLDPTLETQSRYVAYTSQFIASALKYLTGVRHFL